MSKKRRVCRGSCASGATRAFIMEKRGFFHSHIKDEVRRAIGIFGAASLVLRKVFKT